MAAHVKRASRKSIRQSVTLPAALASEVRRVSKERRVTMSRALVALAERGLRADVDAKAQLRTPYRRFLDENDPVMVWPPNPAFT